MVKIGGRRTLWHIMNIYTDHGRHDSYVVCGYKDDFMKRYFAGFHYHNADLHVIRKNGVQFFENISAPDRQIPERLWESCEAPRMVDGLHR